MAETPWGTSLKCDVFVDAIHNVSILTTTRSIYVESSLESLSLQARDSENNIFTSLEGLEVNWTIDSTHLKTIAAEDAKVLLPGISPNKSAALIVQGTRVGKTWASAVVGGRVKATVDLVVVEPIALFPSPVVRTLPHHHIPFKLCSTRVSYDGNMEMKCVDQLKLPSQNYRIETSQETVLTATQEAYATTHNVGAATISAVGTVLEDNGASCYVIVDYPYRAEQPEQYVALGDDPVFNPVLYDKDGHKFDLFEPVPWNITGDWSTVGRKEIKLSYYRYSFTAIVFVVPPITITPDEAVLPVGYDGFPMKVSGGSGNYTFFVENEKVIDYVNQRVRAIAEGVSLIRVQDRRISKYTATASIFVSRVGAIDIELKKRELLVGASFEPKCTVYAKNNKRFSVNVPSKTASDKSNVVASSMRGNSPGFANITCECDGVSSDPILVSVADTPRVKLTGRASPDSIVPLGLSGGVLKWPASSSPEITIDCPGANTTIFEHGKSFAIDREYSGTCELKMKNLQTSKNPIPLEVQTSFQLECSKVTKLVMHVVDRQASQVSGCNTPPATLTTTASDSYRIVPDRVHELFVIAHDAKDRIVNYYSAVKFTVSTNFSEVIKPMENLGINGETQYQFTPKNSTDLYLVSPDLGASTVSLSAIPRFVVTPNQVVYYKPGERYSYDVDGGSGIFATTSPNATIHNGRLTVQPSGPGDWNFVLTDKCRNQKVDVELQALTVTRLQIVTPSIVEVGSVFQPTVRAFNDTTLIPRHLLKDAGLNMFPTTCDKIDIDKWNVTAEKIGKLTLRATAENGKEAKAIIDVIDLLRLQPQHIVMLPGDSVRLEIVSGPSDVSFDCGDESVARMNGFDVVGVAPGNVTINVTSKYFSSMGAYPIYVHVLTPLALHIQPSTTQVIEGGFLGLNLFVETTVGLLRARKGQWSVQSNFNWKQHNASFVFVNCSTDGDLLVKCDAYGLTTSFHTLVEPKLELVSPSALTLPVRSSMKIELTKDLQCVYTSLNEDLVTCDNGVIRTGDTEGEAILLVRYGHQTLALTVLITRPSFLHVLQSPPADFQLLLLDPFGRQYSSLGGLSIDLSGPEGFNSSALDPTGYCKSDYSASKHLHLAGSASNELFSLQMSINVSVSIQITPENPVVMRGASMTVQCTAKNPVWTVSDNHTAYVADGLVIGRAPGKVLLRCGKAAETYLTVVDITDIQLMSYANDVYQIKTSFSAPGVDIDNVAMLPDLRYSCDWTSYGCGIAKHVSNSSGHFCILERTPGRKCAEKTTLRAMVSSETTKLQKSTEFVIEYTGTINFGMPNRNKVIVTDTNRKVHLPIIVPVEELRIVTPRGLTADTTMASKSPGIVIRADDSFKTSGIVIIEHKATGERVQVEIIHESTTGGDSAVIHQREFQVTGDIKFYICLVALFVTVFFIVKWAIYCSDE